MLLKTLTLATSYSVSTYRSSIHLIFSLKSMARKRKSRVSEAPQEPDLAQTAEPESFPAPGPGPEPEPEQPQNEETLRSIVEEAVDAEEYDGGSTADDGGEQQPDNMNVHKEDIVAADLEKKETEIEIPEQNDVSEYGGEAEELNEESDDELEEEPVEKLLEPFSKDQLALLMKEAVVKHPDLIENVHKLADADPAHCKIFLHGLGWEANTETITSIFGKYGEIEDCKVVKDRSSGKSKGYGFILYKNRNGARRALKEPQKKIEGRMTSCQLASAGPVQAPPPSAVAASSGPLVSEYTQRKIYVSNVSAELDTNKLMEFFSKFGEIEEGPLGLDKQTGKPRGFCLFVYKNVESAKKALEEPHKNFEGHMLQCQKAIDGPKHSKGFLGQAQQQPQHVHHQQGNHGYYNHPAKKGRYAGSSGRRHKGGQVMAPSAVPSVGFNQGVGPAAIGQAMAALLATQGTGLGIGNLLGGIGGGMNPQGVPTMMTNAGYGGQSSAGGYGGQPSLQGAYGGQPQMGQCGVRPHQGGAPYMGHGR